jgi:hypothetical protein
LFAYLRHAFRNSTHCARLSSYQLPLFRHPKLQHGTQYAALSQTTDQSRAIMAAEAFRFLDLPAELRLMIYEQIDFTTTLRELGAEASALESGASIPTTASKIHLSRKALDCSILAASRQVYQEAASVFAAKLQQLAKNPVRFRLGWSKVAALLNHDPESGIRAYFDAQHSFSPDPSAAAPLTSEFAKHCFFYLQHARQISRTATDSHDIEFTLTTDEDASVSDKASVLLSALVRIFAASDGWKLATRVVHGYCPPLHFVGRRTRCSIAHVFQVCRRSFEGQAPESQEKFRVESQELSQEDWAQHLESWGN